MMKRKNAFFVPELGRMYSTYTTETCFCCCPIVLFASPLLLARTAWRWALKIVFKKD